MIYTRGLETGPVILSARVSAGAGGEDGVFASSQGGVGDGEDELVAGLDGRCRHCGEEDGKAISRWWTSPTSRTG